MKNANDSVKISRFFHIELQLFLKSSRNTKSCSGSEGVKLYIRPKKKRCVSGYMAKKYRVGRLAKLFFVSFFFFLEMMFSCGIVFRSHQTWFFSRKTFPMIKAYQCWRYEVKRAEISGAVRVFYLLIYFFFKMQKKSLGSGGSS